MSDSSYILKSIQDTTYPSCKPSDPMTEFDVDIVDLEVVPGAREKSVVLSPPSLSKFGNFH